MVLYQLDEQGYRYNETNVRLDNGIWCCDQYRKIIEVRLPNTEDFELYRHLPAGFAKFYPGIAEEECEIKAVNVIFRFGENCSLKVYGEVWLQCPGIDTYLTHKLQTDISRLELAQTLSRYFANSPDHRGHSVTFLQSLYWYFVEWCFQHFSLSLEKLYVDDQECYISAMYDAFQRLSVNPFVPYNPNNAGRAALHWSERGEDGRYSVDHYLFMGRDGRLFHYCEMAGVLFEEVG